MLLGDDRSDDFDGLFQGVWVGKESGSGELEVLGQRARDVGYSRSGRVGHVSINGKERPK